MIRRLVVALLAALTVGSAHPASASSYHYWTYWHGDAKGWHFAAAGPYFTHLTVDPSVDGWRFASSDPYGPPPPAPATAYTYASLCHDAPRANYVRLAIVIDFGVAADAPPGDRPPDPRLYVACTLVPVGTDAFTALQNYAKVQVRADPSSFICGIAGYPRTDCADVNGTASPQAAPTLTPSATSIDSPTPTVTAAPPSPSAKPSASATVSTTGTPAVQALGSPAPIAALTQPVSHGHWWPLAIGGALVAALGLLARARSRRG